MESETINARTTVSRQSKIQEDTYYRVMRLLQEQPDMSQRDLADKVGISLGALNYCLKALMDTRRYFHDRSLPPNVMIHPRTNEPGVHYAGASLVLNLSRPDLWVETFGLTLLEAMTYGVPVIAPPAGGPLEIVRDDEDGFLVDSRDGGALVKRVLQLADDEVLCLRLSASARSRAGDFSQAAFAQALREVLASLTTEKSAT